MSAILQFYRLEDPDSEGRWLEQYWTADDEWMEVVHDFIQWMFPSREASAFNPDAPLLTDADVAAFRQDSATRAALRRSFERFARFLGLEVDANVVRKGPNFEQRARDCWGRMNHNWLRITRCLTSLRTLGLEPEAAALFTCLQQLRDEGWANEEAFGHWERAT
jgi:hypothetical protein